ncbi:Heat Shock Protein 70 (HSP70) [Pleurotus pulmonarius]
MHLLFICHLLSFLALLPSSVYASVLAIDYGADGIKASLMKPGVPFDVLLNKDSKRKIQASVAWKNGDRLFGADAFNMASRVPKDTFSSLKFLQAAPYDSPIVNYYGTISSADLVETSRRTVGLKRSDGSEWSVEELIAMQFAYIKHLAEAVAGEKVYDVIVTVPPFYSQFERDAVADAIEIAGLRTLALVNDGTAVAVNYAMTRTFTAPETHIIFDAGASAIRATVVTFDTMKDASKTTTITVSGVGYDRITGGTELDRRLREILIAAFNNKHKRDIRGDKKGMAKLWKEAGRVKAILSANSEAMAAVESAAFDLDFKTKVTRAEFEEACADLVPRFAQPIWDALVNAGLSLENISSVILTGGSTRTPMIQAAIKAAVGEDKIALNVNADEAAVLGAALHGASLSRQFKTKSFKVSDIGVHNIQASYFATSASPSARPRTISTLIFPAGSKVGTKKTLTFKRKEDFAIWLDYKNLVAPGFPMQILEAEISGVGEALQNLTDLGAVEPVVKATLSLSESGFVSVTDAVAFGEIKDESLTGKLKGFFGAGSSASPEETETGSAENTPPRDTTEATSSTASPSASSNSSAPEETEVKKPVPKENTIPLNITVKFVSIPPMTVAEKKTARSRLRAADAQEAAKTRREEARNTFEAYLYRLRDLLEDENQTSPFKKCSKESERATISEKLDSSFNWLHEKGDDADTPQFLDKRSTLETLERPIIHRYQEIEAFPRALNTSQMWNWSTRLFLTEAKANLTAEAAAGLPSKWTAEELTALEKTLLDHESWLNEWVEKQKSVKFNEDPVIETTEMKARAKVLETHLQKLVKRKVPKQTKPKTTSSATTSPTSSTPAEPTAESDTSGEGTTTTTSVPPEQETAPPVQGHDEL